MIHHIARAPLDRLVAIHAMPPQVEAGIIDFEAAIEPRRRPIQRIKNQRSDKSAGVIPLRTQEIRQVRKPRRERDAKVVDPVELRVSPRKDRRMRCGGDGNVGVGTRESYTLAGHRVEIRSQPALRTEEAHAVGAGGIERDEDDVGMVGID